MSKRLQWLNGGILGALTFFAVACSPAPVLENTAVSDTAGDPSEADHDPHANRLTLPDLAAVELHGEPLQVVATTSIIGDVVAQVGGDAIGLTTLMEPGQDPHSYVPAARDLTAVAQANIIFVNGWDLEEGLVHDLEEISANVPLVAISANIEPLPFAEGAHNPHGVDPHVWFNIHNVEQWVKNVMLLLSELDPDNAELYESQATAYLAELEALAAYTESQLAQIPEENRLLVTNHDSFSYLAKEYGFELIGTVIPAASTLAEPSAADLAELIAEMEAHGVCTIFTETTVSDNLAQTVTAELNGCNEVQVRHVYTGALGTTGSGADSYLGMMRANVATLVAGLK